MTASARHPAAQPRLGRRRRGCAMTASWLHLAQGSRSQYPGRWSRKGRASRSVSRAKWGAGRPAGRRESRRDVRGQEERKSCRARRSGHRYVASVGNQRDNAGSIGWGRGGMILGYQLRRTGTERGGSNVSTGRGAARGGRERSKGPDQYPTSVEAEAKEPGIEREGFIGREGLRVDGLKRREGKRVERLTHVVSSASRSLPKQPNLRYQNRCPYRTPARTQAIS